MCSLRFAVRLITLVLFCAVVTWAQSAPPARDPSGRANAYARQIQLVVPTGTPLRIALDQRIRIQRSGEPVHAKLLKTVYAFDEAVIPAGSELTGQITRIEPIKRWKRVVALANGDFTPAHGYALEFDSLVLPNGKQVSIATEVSPGTAEVVHLASDPQRTKKKNAVARAAADAKKQAGATVHSALVSIKAPGRLHRVRRYLAAQLPYRRQYLEPGTRFDVALKSPLDFGLTTRTNEELADLGTPPAAGSLLEARLAAEVSSATAQQGTAVEAIVTAPLFSPDHKLVIPVSSKLIGEVVQAKSAGKLHHNGQLRVVFQRIEWPDGAVQSAHASLAGVEVDRSAGLQLDAEGGAQATDGKSRYLSTGLSIAIAAAAAQPDREHGSVDPAGDTAPRTVAGGLGLRLVGSVAGLLVRSQAFSSALGAYGAAFSIYAHFLSRGRDVVFSKNTSMEIEIGRDTPDDRLSKPAANPRTKR